jgi:hypothetical protein
MIFDIKIERIECCNYFLFIIDKEFLTKLELDSGFRKSNNAFRENFVFGLNKRWYLGNKGFTFSEL